MQRRLPIGISDFKEIVERDYAYIDKTLLIQEIYEHGTKVILMPRPRRFGKTLNLSMLRYFFEKSAVDHSHLFINFNIWKQEKYKGLQGQFPLIFLSLKEMKDADWETAYGKLKLLISDEFARHYYLLENPELLPREKLDFQEIIDRIASQAIYENSLKMLSKLLSQYHKRNVMILIDEYDTPVISSYLNNYYDPMMNFMRNWLTAALKDNSFLEQGIMTGILRVAKESFFSGLNNLSTFTILNETFSSQFGLLEKEVISLLAEFDLMDCLEEMRKWYNGYRIGSKTLYNPWSILQCIYNKGQLQPYWVNTSENELLKQLIIQGGEDLKIELEQILLGQELEKPFEESLSFESLAKGNSEAIWNILLFSGYLTPSGPATYKGIPKCSLKIPNLEIASLYNSIIREWFTASIQARNFDLLLSSLITGNMETFISLFEDFLESAMSYYDIGLEEPEKIYHAFILGMLISLRDTHEVKSNRESGYGRYDVMLIPKDHDALGNIFEFKKIRAQEGKDLNSGALSALQQIEDKNYKHELQERGIRKILCLGLAFQGKKVMIKYK
ncbi:MAG: AAA family ATPase [Parachlamydiaceae bacterium]|nr:AAA family ATPase [Parachlamydiaceae bacterium]